MFGDPMMKLNVKNVLNFLNVNSHVDKSGFLHKKGELNKGWQKRWFILKGNLLFYYQNPHDPEPIGLIVLEGCSIKPCPTDPTTFTIVFSTEGARTYYLCSDDEVVTGSWVSALQRSSYGYLRAQVERLHNQVSLLEQKRDMYADLTANSLARSAINEGASSSRSSSLNAFQDLSIDPTRSTSKQRHGLRAFSSPLTTRRRASPNIERGTCRSFAKMHQDYAPGAPVNYVPPTSGTSTLTMRSGTKPSRRG